MEKRISTQLTQNNNLLNDSQSPSPGLALPIFFNNNNNDNNNTILKKLSIQYVLSQSHRQNETKFPHSQASYAYEHILCI